MKVLIVSQYYWPENFRINQLAADLVRAGDEVTVLTGLPNYPAGSWTQGYGWRGPYTESREGVRIVRAPLIPRGPGGGLRLAFNYLSFALSASVVGLLRCRERYDAIFVHEPSPITVGIPSSVLGWARRAPVLFWVLDLWPESLVSTGAVRSPRVLRAVEGLVRWIYRRCALVLGQSPAFLPELENMGVPSARTRYFPASAEDLYQPLARAGDTPEARLIAKCVPQGFRLMFAGNVGEAQDFETILGAAEILRDRHDLQWVIVGDGRRRAWVEAEVARRGLSRTVHLLGQHPLETMPAFFAQADAMLVTLKARPNFAKTIPAKIQSYLACAKPVIGSTGGTGAQVIAEAGAGLNAEPERPAELAARVSEMAAMSDEQRAALGLRGRRYFEAHFDNAVLVARLREWMREEAARMHAVGRARPGV